MSDVQIDRRVITPKMAVKMLDKNTNNRNLSDRHMKSLSDEMRNKRWKFNGDSIRLNGDTLIDGQHRLRACIHSGTPFETLVITGLDSDVFDTIDAGKKRSSSDVLSIRGEKNANNLSSALLFIERYQKGALAFNSTYSSTRIEEVLRNNPDIRVSVNEARKLSRKHQRLMPASVLMGCYYLFSKSEYGAHADSFIKKLMSGANISTSDPVYLLREKLLRNLTSTAKYNTVYIAAVVIKTWNFTVTGKIVKKLTWDNRKGVTETFPIVK